MFQARAYFNLTAGAVTGEVVVDEAGADALALVVLDPLQQVAVEHVPEVGLWRSIAEPSAVVSVGTGSHERREVAVPGALGHFMNEPARLHPCLLGVEQFTVPVGARTTAGTTSTCRNSTTVPASSRCGRDRLTLRAERPPARHPAPR